jgi:hypothetical protein
LAAPQARYRPSLVARHFAALDDALDDGSMFRCAAWGAALQGQLAHADSVVLDHNDAAYIEIGLELREVVQEHL